MLERLKELLQEELARKTHETCPSSEEQQVVVARQPVFNLEGAIWGYELLYRRPQNLAEADITSGTVATANVIINGFETVRPSLTKSQKVLINFNGDLIETQAVRLLPAETCIVEILEDVTPTPGVLDAVGEIKKAGYTIALDDYIGQKALAPFLPLADIIKIDVLDMSPRELAHNLLRLRGEKIKATLLAEKVENEKTVEICRKLGFSLFQGYFFSKPEVMHGKKISTSQAVRMHILALCVGDEIDTRAVSDAVLHDPLITARFLRFVNSAHFGFRKTIKSVHHALTLVGSVTFLQWLCVNVLASLEGSIVSHELAFLASQRGKFLETLGSELSKRNALPPGVTVSSLFLCGLFSLLESVMRMPLEDILNGVPLDKEVLMALTGGESPYTPWLKLMDLYERGDWAQSIAVGAQLRLTSKDIAAAYAKALEWSSFFFTRP